MNKRKLIDWLNKFVTFMPISQSINQIMGGDLAPSLKDGNKFAEKIFEWPFLGKNFILTPKFSDDLFIVIDCILCPLIVSAAWNLIGGIYNPFLDQKPIFHNNKIPLHTFFTQFVLWLTSDNSTSRNIVGTDALVVPTSNLGGRPLSPP